MWRFYLLLVLLPSFLTLAGCAVNPVTGRSELALMSISPSQEVEIGRKTFPEVLQRMGGVYPDPELEAYVNEVGRRLGRVSHRPELDYRFKVVNDSVPNAFALPGGFIAVSRGLLTGLENEAQLAAVLGHEIGHVTARHAVQGMQRGTLLGLGVALLDAATRTTSYGALAHPAGQLAAGLINNRYSREQEGESDRLGIDYMVRAGYDPEGSVQVMEYFYRKVEKGADPDWLAGLFRSHPFSIERMRANRSYIETHYAARRKDPAMRIGVDAYLAATRRLRAVAPAYALYDKAKKLEKAGKIRQAISTYLAAAEKGPDEALILTGLGMAYLRADDPVAARQHLQRALRLDDGYYLTLLGMGYIELQQGQAEKALTHLERSMELLATVQGAFLQAEACEKTGRRQKALRLYQAVAKADPGGKLGRTAARRAARLGGVR
ncbi:putative Zn-dependent protease [Geothermobacter ehrlichii]|uniref:Putative Zn-dependent protease n=1 Tax=Geothermobacter ehrlichii TaxID=213224 RepID=A0A5D3WNT3_9BACT|nr:M48 family metalloprotease [Geothermobacter ehrlichii]TYO99993.1 putative Zn-dependent protease [Geothermobacter ehrlichii]